MEAGTYTVAGTARFVSDLHLRQERPELTERFSRFLTDCIDARINALFILGDLFEYWIGDDNLDDPFITDVVARLRHLSDSGIALFFIHGNRDFLIGPRFAAETGARLLPEQCVLEIRNSPVGAGDTPLNGVEKYLLLHGDTLCTDDQAYQDFRAQVRSEKWQQEFLAKPIAERRAEVIALRQRSTEAVRHKSPEIMDVNPLAVRQTLAASACPVMIHGHTHRPGCEVIDANSGSERWVLSDWEDGRGDALEVRGAILKRLDWSH